MSRPWPGPARGPVRAGVPVDTVVAPNPLWQSNGVVVGPDGRLWIAQFLGGVVAALDPATGALETVLGPDGPLVAPDDLAVDRASGAVYVVDLPPGLVWRRDPDGTTAVVADGIVAPDGIAVGAGGRLFVNELVPDGRLLEIDLAGGPPRVMATGLVLGNAMALGPDGLLYFPHLGGGEVWRVDPDGGAPERVLHGLAAPVAVRFSPEGELLVLSNAEPVVWVHALDGTRRRTAQTGVDGADNLAVGADGTWYVTGAFGGGLVALGRDGSRSTVLPEGLAGPFGLAADGDVLLVADHHRLVAVDADGGLHPRGHPWRGAPSGQRGIAVHRGTAHVTTEGGALVAGDRVRAQGLRAPGGLAAVDDGLLVAEGGTGRVLHVADDDTVTVRASGLDHPGDVAVDAEGRAYVSDVGRGQVVRLSDGAVLAAGLARPEGLAALGGDLFCTEAGTGRLLRLDVRTRRTVAVVEGLPLAVAPAHTHPRHATNPLARRPVPFAPLAVDGDTLLVGCSGDGSIRRVRPAGSAT